MADLGMNGAFYDRYGNLVTDERLCGGWSHQGFMPFATLPMSDVVDLAQSSAAKRRVLENGEAESLKKRSKVSSEEQWMNMLERLRAFRDRFGHCNVPKRHPEDPQLYDDIETNLRISLVRSVCEHVLRLIFSHLHCTEELGWILSESTTGNKISRIQLSLLQTCNKSVSPQTVSHVWRPWGLCGVLAGAVLRKSAYSNDNVCTKIIGRTITSVLLTTT